MASCDRPGSRFCHLPGWLSFLILYHVETWRHTFCILHFKWNRSLVTNKLMCSEHPFEIIQPRNKSILSDDVLASHEAKSTSRGMISRCMFYECLLVEPSKSFWWRIFQCQEYKEFGLLGPGREQWAGGEEAVWAAGWALAGAEDERGAMGLVQHFTEPCPWKCGNLGTVWQMFSYPTHLRRYTEEHLSGCLFLSRAPFERKCKN